MAVEILRCDACGASQPLSPAARRNGWYRCGYCETPHATPVSSFEVYEGPESGVVLLSREGRHEFILPAGRLCDTRTLGIALFLIWTLGAMLAGIFQLNPPDHFLYSLGPAVVVGGVLVGTALFLRARLSTQHLVLRSRSAEAFRNVWGHRWNVLRFPFGPGGPDVEVAASPEDRWGAPRQKVRLDSGERGAVELNCSGQREARWLEAMIAHGAQDGEAHDVTRCLGCGAPLGVGLAERGEGRLRCVYCNAGFVVGARDVRWGPARLPSPDSGYDLPPHYVRMEVGDGVEDFELLPALSPGRWFFASGLALNTVFWGAFAWGMLGWLAPDAVANGVARGFVSWMVMAGIMFAFLAAFTAIAAANIAWGSERLRLTEGTVEHAWLLRGRPVPRWLQLGGWKTYRRLLTDSEERERVNIFVGFTHALSRSVALMRLTEVRFSRNEWGTVAELESPARTLTLSWDLPDYSDRWLRDRLVDGIRTRLQGLGREVVES